MPIKKPDNGRATFALIMRGKTIYDPRIDAVNKDLERGLPQDELISRMKAIRASLQPVPLPLSFTNLRLVEECHQAKLKRKPHTVDAYSLKRGLIRAVEAIGSLALTTASEDELVNALHQIKEPSRRYGVAKGLNELLRFHKRGFILYNPKPPRPEEIDFIRIDAFSAKLSGIKDEGYRDYLGALFATGCRWGELPEAKLTDKGAIITHQLDKYGVRRLTKNRKGRTAPLIPLLNAHVVRLNALGRDAVRQLRLTHYPAIFKAAKTHLGVRIHDLRHSYAVEWGTRGASSDDLARWIGDTKEVVERHYRNFLALDEEIDRAIRLWTP